IDNGKIRAVILASGETIVSDHVVLAIGHSARDTFHMLYERGVYVEAKPFSLGFRIEHPQSLIDKCRFGPSAGHPILGAADYKLGGSNYDAPGQLVGDFLAGRASTEFGSVLPSYKPGVHLGDLSTALPDYAITAMREAIPAFDKQIRGFAMADAVLTGVETRT